jgi:methionyl aminopeptidase
MVDLKTPEEIQQMRQAGRLAADTLRAMRGLVRPGVSTRDLDDFAESYIRKGGGRPAFKGYRGYPASICVSINQEVVHGIPSSRRLLEGDLVSIDVGTVVDGFCGDYAESMAVGGIDGAGGALMRVTLEALHLGIAQARAGARLQDISAAVQEHVERHGYAVVRDFVGHGIGRRMHEDPQVPNFGARGRGIRLQAGMVLAIEPMVNEGGWEVQVEKDGWTVVTRDGKRSAHFEHVVAITEDGPEILTRPTAEVEVHA